MNATIFISQVAGMLIGVGICLLYMARQLHMDEQEYQRIRENTALIVDFMWKQHERKMETMRVINEMRARNIKIEGQRNGD